MNSNIPLNESFAFQCFEHSNEVEICNGIMFNFYLGHMCCLECALLPSGVSVSTMVLHSSGKSGVSVSAMVLHSSGKTADSQSIATVDIGVAID